ncbi:MAG: excinuclease ABC subunit B, partial [Clostridiales bacterium]|nr:excinuclease ABC subunit B [Clostridiales bacterium]
FGCSGCYGAFHHLVIDYLSGLRGQPEQETVPRENAQTVVRLSLDDLRQRLEAAVREEDYEQAATLRDQLRQIEAAAAGGEEANDN